MSQDVIAAIVTVALTVLAGLAGYLFREYRTRTKPFLAITDIDGSYRADWAMVQVPNDLVTTVNSSFAINKLDAKDSLSEIFKSWDDADDVVLTGDDLLRLIDKFIDAADNNNSTIVQNSLAKILKHTIYKRWLSILLVTDSLTVPKADKALPIAVSVTDSSEYEGCVWFGFPREATVFGKAFHTTPIVKEKCQPFIDLVERLDMSNLAVLFREIKSHIQTLIVAGRSVHPQLAKILDENSCWGLSLFVANLGRHPFLINMAATLHVKESTDAKYHEKCHLVLTRKDKEGKAKRTPAHSPLIVRSESDVEFAFFTSNVQGKMDHGDALRVAFNSQGAKCWVEFEVEKVGLLRRKKLTTPIVPFHEEESRDQ